MLSRVHGQRARRSAVLRSRCDLITPLLGRTLYLNIYLLLQFVFSLGSWNVICTPPIPIPSYLSLKLFLTSHRLGFRQGL